MKDKPQTKRIKPKVPGHNPFKTLGNIFSHGDIFTKLSFLIMGLSNLVRGQIIKGLIFLGSEVGFGVYLYMFGITSFSHLDDLGEKEQGMVIDPDTMLPVKQAGDNSMLILLAGVVAIVVTAIFVAMWYASVKAGYEAQQQKAAGHVNSFIDDIKLYFDRKIHRTLMFFPCIGILVMNVLPLLFMILIAFTNFDKDHQPPGHLFHWVGLKNFEAMLDSGSVIGKTFWPILGWTFIWAIFATFLNYIFGIILALLINRKGTRLKKMWRTFFILSIALPQFVSLLVLSSMLAPDGAFNVLLRYWGLIGPKASLPFLTDPTWAKVTVIIVNLWVGVPYTLLISTGILQNIPEELYESAKMDGAGPVRIFMKITMPYMLFVTTPYLITQFVGNLNNFNVIFLLSGGNPITLDFYQSGRTDLLVTWLYKLTVNSFDYSYASVIGIFVFIISAVISLLTYRRTKSYNDEEGFQ